MIRKLSVQKAIKRHLSSRFHHINLLGRKKQQQGNHNDLTTGIN